MLSIIVPVFNERGTVKLVVERLCALALEKEIVVVDDGSSDGSRELLKAEIEGRPGVTVVYSAHAGKGAAVRRGIAAARGELVIVHDADLELEPADVLRVTAPLREGRAEIAFGSRFLEAAPRVFSPHYWANRALTGLANALFGSRLTDVACCYKCCRKDLLESLRLESEGFELDCELAAKLLRLGKAPLEVPVSYRPRSNKEGKKIGWLDGVEAAAALLTWRFVRIERDAERR